jgi:hypothetical protein
MTMTALSDEDSDPEFTAWFKGLSKKPSAKKPIEIIEIESSEDEAGIIGQLSTALQSQASFVDNDRLDIEEEVAETDEEVEKIKKGEGKFYSRT